MTLGIHTKADLRDRTRGAGRGLLAGAMLLLAAGGLLLWWSRGAAVFGDIVLAAVAWCF
jgi:hypothetical protein